MRTVVALLLAALPMAAPAADHAYVVMGDRGPVARVVTDAAACPALTVDGRAQPMGVRFAAATVPQRPTASTPENSKPSAFPVTVCDAPLPASTRRASVAGVALPLPRRLVRRIVVIGDTGCRIKAADYAAQACDDPAAFPFARIAARAAAEHPDLVVHVGDYLYRENPCPDATRGCTNSPWGYGWDAWAADFFAPAAPLLTAAPWVMVRGNHESCARAGQGWWRFLDGHRAEGRSCDAAANDATDDWSAPFAVPLGGGAQVVVLDLAIAPNKPLAADDWRAAAFERSYAALADLAAKARFTFAADHQPILGFSTTERTGTTALVGGNVGDPVGLGPPRSAPAAARRRRPAVGALSPVAAGRLLRRRAEPVHHRLLGHARGCRAAPRGTAARSRARGRRDRHRLRVVDRRFRLHGPRPHGYPVVAGDGPRGRRARR